MADRRRIVTLDSAGTATVLVDLEAAGAIQAVRDSFKVNAPARKPVMSQRARRYAGARTVFETHDNGSITETLLVQGASVDLCIAQASTLLKVLEAARQDLFFEWRPDGASSSTFYEVRGPATYKANPSWAQLTTANSMMIDVTIPVAPLAWLTPQTFTISSTDLPAVKALASIGGDAPALANITVRTNGGTSPPIWALYGWWKHPTATPLSGSVAPIGLIEAETGASLSGWAAIGTDANYRGSNGLRVTTSGAGTASASYVVDPSVLDPDDFAMGEIDLEIWARVELASTVLLPRINVGLVANSGLGGSTYTPEFGSTGRAITRPATGNRFRMVRLGVLTMPVDKATPVKWNLNVATSWAAGSSGSFGLDYLAIVPARSRACSKTGVANDSAYPDFIGTTADTSKTIRGQDLSGLIGSAAANQGRDSGLGGSLIELPPGDVDMLLKLSSLVPDDPTSDSTSEQLAHASTTGTITVIPRVFLAK